MLTDNKPRQSFFDVKGYGRISLYGGEPMSDSEFVSNLRRLDASSPHSILEAYKSFWQREVQPLAGVRNELVGTDGHRGDVLIGRWNSCPDNGLFVRLGIRDGDYLQLALHRERFTNAWEEDFFFEARLDDPHNLFFSSSNKFSLDGLKRIHALGEKFLEHLHAHLPAAF